MRPERTESQLAGARRLKIGFVVLVGLSGGMIALQADASPSIIVAAVCGGLVAGASLLWYLLWVSR